MLTDTAFRDAWDTRQHAGRGHALDNYRQE